MTRRRLTTAAVDQMLEGLSERDRAIVHDLALVRVLSGNQLTRLHFDDLSLSNRDRARRRVLARLGALDVVTTLERRIGGYRAGSAGLVYALGVAGQHLAERLERERQQAEHATRRARKPWTPGTRFLAHTLAISELYVQLDEAARAGLLTIEAFAAEPAAWIPDGLGGWLKPDAYVMLRAGDIDDSWWIELDRATESLPTVRRKLTAYLDFVSRGQLGPHDVIPRVLVVVPNDQRCNAVHALLASLPEPASKLFCLAVEDHAVADMVRILRE